MPEGARTAATPLEDPNNINPEHAGDIFYVDNGKVKGINLEGAQVMDYHVYSNVENDPIAFFKEVGDVNKLVDEDGNYLNITETDYKDNIQFVFQAEEDKSVYYVAPVRGNRVNMFQARIVQGDFPDKYEWTPFDAGEPVDTYWWIDSEHVRVEERFNPALGVAKKQIDYITSFVDSGGYTMDFLKYSNPLNNGREIFVNKIEEVTEPVVLKIIKKDAETAETIPEVAFVLKSRNNKYFATSTTNRRHSSIPNAYVTDENGELTFQIYSEDKDELDRMLRTKWILEEVEAATGYGEQTYVKSLNWLGEEKTFQNGEQITLSNGESAIEYKLDAENKPEEKVLGKLTLSKEWYEKNYSVETPTTNPPSATFRLWTGSFGDTSGANQEITISADNPTFSMEDMMLGDYWIEEVDIPENMSVTYNPGQAFTLSENSPEISISVKNVEDITEKEYTVAIAKKQSKSTTMQGTPDSNFTHIPYYDGPAQFEVRYTGDDTTYQGWMTTITYDRSEQESTGYMNFKVPTYGVYTIEEINFPDTFYPEIQIVGTSTWNTFGDGARFSFRVPDAPGEAPAITLKVVNNRPATMEVVKKDKDTGARIWDSNMELTMYASNPDGSRSGRRIGLPQKMGDDGKFVFSSVDYQYTVGDTVWLVETVPPVSSDGTRYEAEEFEVVASQDLVYSLTQLELTNQIHKYDFTIHKEGSKHEPIQGAAFEIYSDANCTRQVAYGESNQNGDVSIKLPAGTYYAKETYVPEPYKLDSKPFEITLGADMTTTSKIITNYPEYKVVVKKVDSITKYGVEDVSFKLLDSNKRPLKIDNVEVTGVSDGTGYVIWNVTGTKYLYTNSDETLYLQETNTNRGYFLNEELVPIDIKTTTPAESGITEGAYTFEVTNDAKFKARVKKTEVLEQRPATPAETAGISGITFEVYKRGSNEDTLIGTYETDSTGVFTTDDLYYGEYYAKEILPDDSIYVSSNEEIPLKIYQMNNLGQFADDNWSTYNLVQNKRKTGSISVYKKTNEGNFLPNVGFTLYHYDGKFNPSKFNIDDCTLVEHKFTDENGEFLFKDLPLGNYWLVETETPTTYIGINPMYITINTDNTDYQLGDLIGQHIQLEVINNRVPLTLRVIKKDAADSKPIQGAVFSLTLNGKSVSGTTNRDGILEFNNLTRGVTYTLKEESVPTPYKADSTPMSITTNDTDILITKEVFNASKPATIQVYKYEKGNLDKPLKGAGFKLFLDGEQIGNIKYTDENGMIEWDNLTVSQNYSIQEVSAPEHYILNDGMRPIAFEEKENIFFCKLNVSNELKDYFVRLLKIDGDSKEKLAGAQFDLYKADKTTKLNTQPILTDSNGLTPSIEVPEPGTYYFKEIKAPSNYQLDDRFVEVQAYPEGGEANIPIFENFEKPKYSIEITKIDSASKNVIAGAEFTLYDEQRNIVDVKVVPESGKVKFTVEELGTYYLRETKIPTGYEPNNTKYRFDVSNDQAIYTQTVENTKKKHIIKVIKQDAENKAPLGEAVFEVFDSNYVKLGELTTTIPSGIGTFEVSGDGIFYLKEKQSPDGYEIISGYIQVKVDAETDVVEKTIYNEKLPEFWIKIYKKDRLDDSAIAGAVFDVFKSDKVTKVGTITIEAPNGFASIEVPEEGNYFLKETKAPKGYEPITDFIEVAVGRDNNIVEKTIYNEQEDKQEYWIKVYKQDVVNKAPLADATFEVFTETNVSLGTFTTTLPNGEGTFKVQGPGVYYLKEIKSPYGYTLKQGFIPVTVSKTNNVVQTTIYNEQTDKEKYVLKVYKKDTTNKAPLEHAVIGVYDSNYKQIGTITTTIPDGSGYFEVDYPGQFYLKEIKAPKGYILKEGFIPVTVNSNTNVVETSIYNEKDEETVYNLITVYKVDQDNNPLKGVRVGLYDKKGKLLETGYTDSRGIVKFEDLDDGTYYVQEIEGLPGYEKITDQIKVAVSDGDSKKVTITNKEIVTEESAWISIKKYVEGSSTPLAGVEFIITGSNGYKSVHTTDNLGSIYINVPVGQYTVTETKGVQGYQMDSTPKSVQATAGTAANEVVFYNKPANGTLVITKVDSTSKEKLSGASFDIIDTATNANVRTVMTDSNGTANVTLPFGTYKVVETQAPTGYVLDVQNSITITISIENTLESITVENSKIPVVTKTPKTGTTPLSMGTVVPFLIAIVSAAILILLHRNEIKRLFNR